MMKRDAKKKCKICFREFESLRGMESHFEMCKKSLSCGKCKKVFDNVKSFEIHINVCSGESKYTCCMCVVKNLMMMLLVVIILKTEQVNYFVKIVK